MTMSERDVKQTLRWVARMRGKALALEGDPRNPESMKVAWGLRATIAQAERLVRGHGPDLLVSRP